MSSWNLNALFLALVVLLAYDLLLTFSREFHCIWKRKISAVTALYVVVRYGTLLQVAFQVALVLWVPPSISSCKALNYASYVVDELELVAIAVFSFLRVCAITGFKLRISLPVLTLGLFAPCITIYSYTFHLSFNYTVDPNSDPSNPRIILPVCKDLLSCDFTPQFVPLLFAARVTSIISDILVLVTTWCKTIKTWRFTRQLGINSSLVSVCLRDGTIYFFAILGLNVFALASPVSFSSDHGTLGKLWIPYAQFSLNAILISRFLLNLRQVDSHIIGDDESHQGYFANRMVGSFGAPLEDPETEYDWSMDATDEAYDPTFRSTSRNTLHI